MAFIGIVSRIEPDSGVTPFAIAPFIITSEHLFASSSPISRRMDLSAREVAIIIGNPREIHCSNAVRLRLDSSALLFSKVPSRSIAIALGKLEKFGKFMIPS